MNIDEKVEENQKGIQKNKMYKALAIKVEDIVKRKGAPQSLLDLPEKFEGEAGTVKKGIETALIMGQIYNLFPENIPYEKLWYKVIKLVAEKMKKSVGYPKISYQNALKHLVEDSGYWYKDFGIKTYAEGESFKHLYYPTEKKSLFPRSIIHLEKESDVEDLLNFSDLMGLDLYTTKGQSPLSKAEKLALILNRKRDRDEPLNILGITDYDPAGLSFTPTLKEHLDIFFNRLGQKIDKIITVAPFPDQYTPKELKKAAYHIAPTYAKYKAWTNPEREKERIDSKFIDPKFKDINFYKTHKDSEIRRILTSAKLKKASQVKWIEEWRKKLKETGEYPHMLGLEVASLPDEPLPHQLPEEIMPEDTKGAARLRLLILDKLLEEFGIKDEFLRDMIRNGWSSERPHIGIDILYDDTDYRKMQHTKDDIIRLVENIHNKLDLDYWRRGKKEGEVLQEKVDKWWKEVLKDLLEDPERKEKFIDELRHSTALDYNRATFLRRYKHFRKPYPTVPEEYQNPKASQELKADIKKDVEYLDSLLKSLKLRTETKNRELGIKNGE